MEPDRAQSSPLSLLLSSLGLQEARSWALVGPCAAPMPCLGHRSLGHPRAHDVLGSGMDSVTRSELTSSGEGGGQLAPGP